MYVHENSDYLLLYSLQVTPEISFSNYTNYSLYEPTILPVINPPCQWTCELTNDAGYVVYSAFGSFYIPMFVMLFFYWRIYRAAVRTTRAINQGFRTTKGKIFRLFLWFFLPTRKRKIKNKNLKNTRRIVEAKVLYSFLLDPFLVSY